jgi:hypothetical protein
MYVVCCCWRILTNVSPQQLQANVGTVPRFSYDRLLPNSLLFIIPHPTYYRALKRLQALRGYSTHLNEQEIPSQRMSRYRCLLTYGRVFEKSGGRLGTSVRGIAAAEGIGVPLVWRILHELSLHVVQGRCFASGFSLNAL